MRARAGQYGGSERKAGGAEASAVTDLQVPGEGALRRVMAVLLPPGLRACKRSLALRGARPCGED